jgi:hypothetical protein
MIFGYGANRLWRKVWAAVTRKRRYTIIISAISLVLAAILAAGGFLAMSHSRKTELYYDYIHDTYVASFYCYSFRMVATADPEVDSADPVPDWGFWPTLFHRVEYVDEFPPVAKREWAVIYIKPGIDTGSRVSDLNEVIDGDPNIVIDERLALPLTVEQVVSCPDAVLEIIKQLDKERWEKFYRYDSDLRKWNAIIYAWKAGIEWPME